MVPKWVFTYRPRSKGDSFSETRSNLATGGEEENYYSINNRVDGSPKIGLLKVFVKKLGTLSFSLAND